MDSTSLVKNIHTQAWNLEEKQHLRLIFLKKIIILACGFEFVKAQKEMVSIQFVGEWTAAQLHFILMN